VPLPKLVQLAVGLPSFTAVTRLMSGYTSTEYLDRTTRCARAMASGCLPSGTPRSGRRASIPGAGSCAVAADGRSRAPATVASSEWAFCPD